MNYIMLTTNLPNPTNIYHVATYKIRQIRPISVRKKYIRVWIILTWPLISLHEYIPCRNLKRFVRFVRFVFEKKYIRVWIILSWPRISRIPRIYTMSQPKKIRQIRPIRVQKKYIRVWIILCWPLISRIKRIYTMSRPTRFVRFVRLVFEKNIFAYELYYVDH